MMRLVAGVLALAALLQAGVARAPVRIPRVDEGAKDPSFAAFRQDLLQAVERRDLDAALEFMSPDVKVARRNVTGPAALRRQWKAQASPTALLDEIKRVFTLGGRFTAPDTFVAPYAFTEVGEPAAGSLAEYTVIVVPQTPVYERPATTAPRIAVLNDELVPYNLGPPGWCIVILPDGREGFVNEKATRAPVDTHAVVVKRPSGWIITEFWGGLE